MKNRIIKFLTDKRYRILIISKYGGYNHISDEKFLKLMFWARMGQELDLNNPKTFNEKLQWLKLYNRNPLYTALVDKYTVKQYVAELIGEKYIIPTYGVYERFDDIDFESLPQQFVLKCTHDSGGIVICNDKETLDKIKAKKTISKSLKRNFYKFGREWPYKDVPPRIICERFMTDGTNNPLMDYKVLCFNGEPKLIEIHRGRFTNNHTQDLLNLDWETTEFMQPDDPPSGITMQKPPFADEMMKMTRILAKGIPHVRVDWYYVNNQLYFGEMTFFDGSGFFPFLPGQDEIIGSWLKLPPKM